MSREVIRIVAGGSFAVMALLGSALAFVSFRRLRRDHPLAWQALGEPTLFWNSSARNRWLFTRFIWSGSYRELKDPAFDSLVITIRAVAVLSVIAFVIFFVSMMR